MTYLCAARRSSYVVDTRRFDIKREAKERKENTKQNKTKNDSYKIVYILSLAIYVVAHIISNKKP